MSANAGVTETLYGNFHFYLEVESVDHDDRKIVAGFTTIAGGGVKVESRDITHGDDRYKRHMPGAISYENITMSRGMTENDDILDWYQSIINGDVDRRSGSIIMLDNAGEEVKRFNFYGAYPVSWSGPELSGEGSAIAIEKFELAVERTEWE